MWSAVPDTPLVIVMFVMVFFSEGQQPQGDGGGDNDLQKACLRSYLQACPSPLRALSEASEASESLSESCESLSEASESYPRSLRGLREKGDRRQEIQDTKNLSCVFP